MATNLHNPAGKNINGTVTSSQFGDESLLASARRGQTAAFGEPYRPHAKKIFHTVYRITKNREDAEDALQHSFVRAYTHIRDFDGRSRFLTWLTRIAINSALMILRKKRTSPEIANGNLLHFDTTELHRRISAWAPNPETQYLRRERERIVRREIRALRPSFRGVVETQQLQERSMVEAAEAMGITVGAAKARLFHARTALRKVSALKAIAAARLN